MRLSLSFFLFLLLNECVFFDSAGCIGQLFFAYRINMISETRTVPIIIIIVRSPLPPPSHNQQPRDHSLCVQLSAASGVSALIAGAQFYQARSFSALRSNTLTSVGVSFDRVFVIPFFLIPCLSYYRRFGTERVRCAILLSLFPCHTMFVFLPLRKEGGMRTD